MWINHELLLAGFDGGSGVAPSPAKAGGSGKGGHGGVKHVNNTSGNGAGFARLQMQLPR